MDLRHAWIPLHFYIEGFNTSSTLFEPIYCAAPPAHSMSVGLGFFPAFDYARATFAVPAQK